MLVLGSHFLYCFYLIGKFFKVDLFFFFSIKNKAKMAKRDQNVPASTPKMPMHIYIYIYIYIYIVYLKFHSPA